MDNMDTDECINDDCPAYFGGTIVCEKGSNCNYRHSEAALGSLEVCSDWEEGLCTLWSACPFRHAPVEQVLLESAATADDNINNNADDDGNWEDCPSPVERRAEQSSTVFQSGSGSEQDSDWEDMPPDYVEDSSQGHDRYASMRSFARNETTNQNNQDQDLRKGTVDCKFYFSGLCNKGDACLFRHSTAALGSAIICEDWKRRRNCPFNKLCNKRHTHVNIVIETNNMYARAMAARQASGEAGASFIPDEHKKKAKDDCQDYIYKECKRGERCYFRHSRYVKESIAKGIRCHLGICPNWKSRPKQNCESCFMLHHIPPEKSSLMKKNTATSSISDQNKEKEKKSSENRFECKICFHEFDEIKERGDRIVSADCGHTMCEKCCRNIMRSSESICPFCRMRIREPRPLFLS